MGKYLTCVLLVSLAGCGGETGPVAVAPVPTATTVVVVGSASVATASATPSVLPAAKADTPGPPTSKAPELPDFLQARRAAAPPELAATRRLIDRQDWAAAQQELAPFFKKQTKNQQLHLLMHAQAMQGQIALGQRDAKATDTWYGRVVAHWDDPSKARKRVMSGDPATAQQRLGLALESMGEALFYFAEKKRLVADAIAFPVYRGDGSKKDVDQHVRTKIKTWMQSKQPAINAAENAYLAVVKLKPVAPPRWWLASGSRVGAMWAEYVYDFRSAPYPKQWDQPGPSHLGNPPIMWSEIRDNFFDSMVKASEVQMRKARRAYQMCAQYSLKFKLSNSFSKSCDRWLAANP